MMEETLVRNDVFGYQKIHYWDTEYRQLLRFTYHNSSLSGSFFCITNRICRLEIFLWTSSGFFLIFYSIFLINNWNECWSRRSILPRLIINLSDRNLVLKVSLELFRLNTSNLENIANNLYLFVSWIIIFVWQGSLATLFTYFSHHFYKL